MDEKAKWVLCVDIDPDNNPESDPNVRRRT